MNIRTVVLLTAVAALACAAPAAADPAGSKNAVTVTLTCPGAAFTGTSIGQANSLPFTLSGTSQVAVSHAIWFFDESNQRVDVRDQPANGLDLVTCTYDYPGFPFLVYGAFAFSGHA
jgi:hypothetical protein